MAVFGYRDSTMKEKFVKKGLEAITRDNSYSHFFQDHDGNRLPQETYRDRMSLLESSLEAAYDARAKEKMKPKGLSSVAATTLRGVAAAGYGLGTAMYYYFPGAGLAFTAPAAAASLAADAIDSRYYHKSGLVKGLGFSDAKIAAESIAAKASGMFPVRYFPIGGLIDLYRGRRKFQGAAIKGLTHDDEVMSYAISKFADKLYESQGKRKVIPLDSLRDHRYSAAGEKQYSVAA